MDKTKYQATDLIFFARRSIGYCRMDPVFIFPSALILAGIKDILIISTLQDPPSFE
jgi:dTDP-glucose pyrophosphorylase